MRNGARHDYWRKPLGFKRELVPGYQVSTDASRYWQGFNSGSNRYSDWYSESNKLRPEVKNAPMTDNDRDLMSRYEMLELIFGSRSRELAIYQLQKNPLVLETVLRAKDEIHRLCSEYGIVNPIPHLLAESNV